MKCKKIANDIDKLRNIKIIFSLSNKTYYIKALSTIDIEVLNEKENFDNIDVLSYRVRCQVVVAVRLMSGRQIEIIWRKDD